jgi:hypothetical protein
MSRPSTGTTGFDQLLSAPMGLDGDSSFNSRWLLPPQASSR